MRHRHEGRKLGKTAEHRHAMLGNMVTSLFETERIYTTVPKAKEAKKLAEHIITQARRGNAAAAGGQEARKLALRRQIARIVHDPAILRKLFDEIAPRYVDRPGGYTRILRLSAMRVGDSAQKAILELLKKDEEGRKKKKTPRKTYHKIEMPKAPVVEKEAEAPAAVEPQAPEAPAGEAAAGAGGPEGAAPAAPGAPAAKPAAEAPHGPAAHGAPAAKAEAPKKEKAHKAEAEKPAAEKKAKAKPAESKDTKPKAKKE